MKFAQNKIHPKNLSWKIASWFLRQCVRLVSGVSSSWKWSATCFPGSSQIGFHFPKFRGEILKKKSCSTTTYQAIQSALLGMVKWPFQGVKWPPTRDEKGTLNHLVAESTSQYFWRYFCWWPKPIHETDKPPHLSNIFLECILPVFRGHSPPQKSKVRVSSSKNQTFTIPPPKKKKL